ncbi:coiled-coil domain-containing protein 18 [Senna tora]|uniref:Coiled-coil domain-containing protein 18 n=1 Tax=Senna tora TaxID=362788 RepID=A0A834T8K6_9FABA|nr:coiled-coil domain-containing protein 18 [Senna tora]
MYGFLYLSSSPFSYHHFSTLLTGLVSIRKRKGHLLKTIKSVLNDKRSGINDYEAAESARILLERLFEQTQKLEEQMTGEFRFGQDVQIGLNLQVLESDLQAALTALKKKEENLQEAERTVLLENSKLNHTKEELERQEREIAVAQSKYEKLEEELKEANLKFASQASQIEDLKLQVRERDQEIAAVQTALSLKEEEIERMKNDLAKKIQEAAYVDSELKSKGQLLNEANEVMRKQEIELQGLRKAIREKEIQLEVSQTQKKFEEEKLKAAEATLEKQAMEWLLAQEELKILGEEAARRVQESNETAEDFRRVKSLLDVVRSELVSSQQSLASSREKMEEQEELLEQQLFELAEQRQSVMSYMENLKQVQVEVESERVKLRVAEARNKELERDVAMEKELVKELQEELKKERNSLKQAVQEMSLLQEKLEQKGTEFRDTIAILHVKESELVDAKLEIQHLKSEKASLQATLEEKDLELSNARKMLEGVNQEIADLKMLLNSKETQLIQATNKLKEKDEHVLMMQNELNNTKLKASEAETVVERILELTNTLVGSIKDEDLTPLTPLNEMSKESLQLLLEKPTNEFSWQQKRLEKELELTKESLKTKELEVLNAQRVLIIKDEELKMTLARLDAKEKELTKVREELKEDASNLKRLYALAQERIGEKSIGDLAIEKLQLEAAQLEIEAATTALHKLAEMSGQLLNKASLSVEADNCITLLQSNSDINCLKCICTSSAPIAGLSSVSRDKINGVSKKGRHEQN